MKTTIKGKTVETLLEDGDQAKLHHLLRRLGPHAKVPSLGKYKDMASTDLWYGLVEQVCVGGSARLLEAIGEDSDGLAAFKQATSLSAWKRKGLDVDSMESVLRNHNATRFPKKAAEKLQSIATAKTAIRGSKVILLDGLSEHEGFDSVRDKLRDRCPAFGMKTASNLMIGVGLSHDVIALDTRVVGVFRDYLDYNVPIAKVQSDERVYKSLEATLREVCQDAKTNLGVLDRTLFQLSGMSVVKFVMEIEAKPS